MIPRRKYKITKEQLQYFIHCKRTIDEIASILHIGKYTVKRYLNDYNLDEHKECKYCKNDNFEDLIMLKQHRENSIVNVCENCFSNNLSNSKTGLTKDYLYNQHVINKVSIYELKRILKCKQHTLLKYFNKFNIEIYYKCELCGSTENLILQTGKNVFKYRRICHNCTTLEQKKILKNKYLKKLKDNGVDFNNILLRNKKGESLLDICKQLKISYNFIKNFLKESGIEEIKRCKKCGTIGNLVVVDCKHKKKVVKNMCYDCMSKFFSHETIKSSKISQDLFNNIYYKMNESLKKYCYYDSLNYEKREILALEDREFLQLKKKVFVYDFLIDYPDHKLVIEFNGDMWHAHPDKFKDDDTPNPYLKSLTAKEIRDGDDKRCDYVEGNGGYFITIWESDYKNNKQQCINYCLSRINEFYINVTNYHKEQINVN